MAIKCDTIFIMEQEYVEVCLYNYAFACIAAAVAATYEMSGRASGSFWMHMETRLRSWRGDREHACVCVCVSAK